jgi:hypothetical protein
LSCIGQCLQQLHSGAGFEAAYHRNLLGNAPCAITQALKNHTDLERGEYLIKIVGNRSSQRNQADASPLHLVCETINPGIACHDTCSS